MFYIHKNQCMSGRMADKTVFNIIKSNKKIYIVGLWSDQISRNDAAVRLLFFKKIKN